MNSQYTIVSGGLRRLKIDHRYRQRVEVVVDLSPSMEGDKEREAWDALWLLCQKLALPANQDAFWMGVIGFAGCANVIRELEPATSLVKRLEPLKAGSIGFGTDIAAGLELADQVLRKAMAEPEEAGVRYLRPVCLLLSDGEHNSESDPITAAARLREVADVVCVGFGNDADQKLLRQLATSEQHFVRCATGSDLRGFLARVGMTLTQTMAKRANATIALGNLQQ